MFQNAAVKLSLYYLAIIMVLSLGFTVFLYKVSSNEVDRSLGRPVFITNDIETRVEYDQFRAERLLQAQESLRANLIVFNICIFVLGGVVSYALARRTLQPIEVAMETQSRFTGDASHELRTPLTAMQTEIEVALRNKQLTKNQAVELLESNLEEITKLRALADALLKLAHDGQSAVVLGPVDLEESTAAAVDKLDKSLDAKHISIQNNLKPMLVQADAGSLEEMLVILLDNAIKYSPKKSTITVASKIVGHEAQLEVIDQGAGITPADLPHIFERFYRSDSSRTKNNTVGGYGLGLAIASNLADLQNAKISVTSTVGTGSNFTIHIPLATTI